MTTDSKASDVTLLPCPFCGCQASLVFCNQSEIKYSHGGYYVLCNGCDLRRGQYFNKYEAESGEYQSEKEATAAWNARASQQPSAQWIAVTHDLPETHKDFNGYIIPVLVHCPRHPDQHLGYYIPQLNEWRLMGSNSPFDVTHWMPLPEPPHSPDTARTE